MHNSEANWSFPRPFPVLNMWWHLNICQWDYCLWLTWFCSSYIWAKPWTVEIWKLFFFFFLQAIQTWFSTSCCDICNSNLYSLETECTCQHFGFQGKGISTCVSPKASVPLPHIYLSTEGKKKFPVSHKNRNWEYKAHEHYRTKNPPINVSLRAVLLIQHNLMYRMLISVIFLSNKNKRIPRVKQLL